MAVEIIGFIVGLNLIAAYFYSVRKDNMLVLDIANVVGAMILFPLNLLAGVFFGAFITAAFGLIGGYGLWKHFRR